MKNLLPDGNRENRGGWGREQIWGFLAKRRMCNILDGGELSPNDLLHYPHHSLQILPIGSLAAGQKALSG